MFVYLDDITVLSKPKKEAVEHLKEDDEFEDELDVRNGRVVELDGEAQGTRLLNQKDATRAQDKQQEGKNRREEYQGYVY